MTREEKQEFTLRITQANETQLVVILYEILLAYNKEASLAAQQREKEALDEAARKMRGCFEELIQSVNPKYELGVNLNKLYFYCLRELAQGQRTYDTERFAHIENVIRPLHKAYGEIAPQNTKGPVMGNSQSVYAGLTYGKNTLMENMANAGSNRGMLV